MNDYIYLKQKDLADFRKDLLNKQDGKCAICSEIITLDMGASLDHQHKRIKDPIGENGGGLIRGVLSRNCNVMEGKIWNNCIRYGISHEDLPDWLESLARYLREENLPVVHPSEVPKAKKVSKRNYNKLKKAYAATNTRAKFPEYPKSSKLTKKLSQLFEKFEIPPYN